MTNQSQVVFDPYSTEFFANPHAIYRRMRTEAPVYYHEELDFYALTRYEDVTAAHRDFQTYSSAGGLDLAMVQSGEPPPPAILYMDPPEHGRMRGLVNKAFTPRAVAAQRETVIEEIQQCLSRADPRRFDVVQDFSGVFPGEVITSMVGVPADYRAQFREFVEEALRYQPGQSAPGETTVTMMLNAAAYCYNLVQERRAEPKDDMISALIAAEIERENGEKTSLQDDEITLFAMLVGGAGTETVTKLVANAVAAFARHPEQWRKLHDDRTKISAAVEEVMRYDSPVLYVVRRTVKDVTLHGVTIPAGKPVLLCGVAANRDPDVFTDPDTFDIDRDHKPAAHLALGYGVHSCLGAALGRMETAIALEHLLDFMPRFEVIWEESQRVNASTVAGWSHLPVKVHRS
jgi:cytochrome P450